MDDTDPEVIEALERLHKLVPRRWLLELPSLVEEMLNRTRYGCVEIVGADGRIVGVDINIKLR